MSGKKTGTFSATINGERHDLPPDGPHAEHLRALAARCPPQYNRGDVDTRQGRVAWSRSPPDSDGIRWVTLDTIWTQGTTRVHYHARVPDPRG